MKFLFLVLFSLTLSGCISATKQSDQLLSFSLNEYQKPVRIKNVPFVNQSSGQCGPATLTMAMNFLKQDVHVDEISQQVYTPGMKGSLQTDMITAARRHGLLAVPIDNLESLIKEITAGNPVIVFENLALSWWPQWHYALVFGYDLSKELVVMHSGPEQNKEWDIRKFERSWKLGDYWGLVVLTPDKLSASVTELTHGNAAVGLEQVEKNEAAFTAYTSMLKRWPKSLTALIGLGNLEYQKKNYKESVRYLKIATKEHPNSSAAQHNLTVALNASKK